MLFEGIKALCKDIASLSDLVYYNWYHEFEEIGQAIIRDKRGGASFDVRKLWETLINEPQPMAIAMVTPFPHPNGTHKDMTKEVLWSLEKSLVPDPHVTFCSQVLLLLRATTECGLCTKDHYAAFAVASTSYSNVRAVTQIAN